MSCVPFFCSFSARTEKIHDALTYLRNQSQALEVFLSDGRVPIDNNDVEQLMKQVAIGRKNW